ncbi:MAG: hypothetical protein AB7D05_05925, partial [Mangrovibacterium sp.]
MKNFLERLKRYYHFFYIILVFMVTIFILYLIIPGENRFRYEFQKNAPWRHETLIAPYDFAILKPEEAVRQERDSVHKLFIPYFRKDTLTGIRQSQNFGLKLKQAGKQTGLVSAMLADSLQNKLKQIYAAGLIDQSPKNHPVLKEKQELNLVTGKVVHKVSVGSLYSLKTAFQALNDTLYNLLGPGFEELSQQFSLSEFIEPNLTYEPDFNNQELSKLTGSVSLTQGMVQAGERIIFSGDLVTPDKFQVLESLRKSFATKKGQNIDRYLLIIGKLILIVVCLLLLILYMNYFRPEIFNQKRHLTFILFIIILLIGIARFVTRHDLLSIYTIPIAILPILLRIFFDSRTAIYALMVTCLLIGYFAPNNY